MHHAGQIRCNKLVGDEVLADNSAGSLDFGSQCSPVVAAEMEDLDRRSAQVVRLGDQVERFATIDSDHSVGQSQDWQPVADQNRADARQMVARS